LAKLDCSYDRHIASKRRRRSAGGATGNFRQAHETDPAITLADKPHYVAYDLQAAGAQLFVFLPGTGGTPGRSPLLNTAIEQGYRAISLSYPNIPAVAQVCVGSGDRLCAAQFRQKRVFGSNETWDIAGTPADSIVNRLTSCCNI
jgi:hypothetical protein